MAPLVKSLSLSPSVTSVVCVTAQHRQMLDQVLTLFDIVPDHDLDMMRPGQSLTGLTARLLDGLGKVMDDTQPDLVLVQGDTTTAFVGALAAFYRKVDVGHVEAGLRTGDLLSPWPEEANRQMVGRLARWHFAPTQLAADNLLRERVPSQQVVVTGNTVIDALLYTVARLKSDPALVSPIEARFGSIGLSRPMVLVTAHRRESFGSPMRNICKAVAQLAEEDNVDVVFPVHPNPEVGNAVDSILKGNPNVLLIPPVDYVSFVFLMMRATLLLSDSGGVQEEAPSLGKPVLVMRDVTERMEAVHAGTVRLVGTETNVIVEAARVLLKDKFAYQAMASCRNPFGDGTAANQIVSFINSRINASL